MNTHNNDGGPAFPQETRYIAPDQQMSRVGPRGGMTLRDYFAAKAMAALIATPLAEWPCKTRGPDGQPSVTMTAYEIADAMLEARQS